MARLPRATRHTTRFLHIWRPDWPSVTTGVRREYRQAASGRYFLGPDPAKLLPPCPVLAHSLAARTRETALLVVERTWEEPLLAISPESLEAEGFDSVREFRRYWNKRYDRIRWRDKSRVGALSKVWVYAIRPFREGDRAELGGRLFDYLYAQHLL